MITSVLVIASKVASHPDAQGQDLKSLGPTSRGQGGPIPGPLQIRKPSKGANQLRPASGSGLILPPVQGVSPGNGIRIKVVHCVPTVGARHHPPYPVPAVFSSLPASLSERVVTTPV